ncbi:MAG: YhbY family RNA-binding protein [Pseudomonadota bacterium]
MSLNNNQKKFLRQAAHHLKPVILTGQHGITDSLITEIEQALARHELIKIKIKSGNKEEREAGITAICDQLKLTLFSVLAMLLPFLKRMKTSQ